MGYSFNCCSAFSASDVFLRVKRRNRNENETEMLVAKQTKTTLYSFK